MNTTVSVESKVEIVLEDLVAAATESVAAFGKDEDAQLSFLVSCEQAFDKVDDDSDDYEAFRDVALAHPAITAILN